MRPLQIVEVAEGGGGAQLEGAGGGGFEGHLESDDGEVGQCLERFGHSAPTNQTGGAVHSVRFRAFAAGPNGIRVIG